MPKVEFTYEVRKAPTDPVWVEDYVVRTSEGESVGTVAAVLERGGERLLVVERGVVAVAQDRRVVPWRDVEQIDHDALAVWLRLDERTFLERADELDPDLAVEEGPAEARRLSTTPDDAVPNARAGVQSGPVDRPLWANMLALFAAVAFSALVAVVVVTVTGDTTWALLLLVPAALAVVLGVTAYRLYRSPYERRAARKP